jgi:uncharacterized membrane protein YdjX (TVP38/TMEM64 family)
MAASSRPRDGGRQYRRFVPVAFLVCILLALYLAGGQHYVSLSYLAERHAAMQDFVAAHPVSAPAAFALFYALAVAVSLPCASILTIFAGFLFGWLIGGTLVVFAATVGATALFLAARSALGGFLRGRIGARAARLADGFEKDAFSYLLVLRLAPIFPFFIVNVAPAFFRVPLRTYVAATFIGILPGTFAYAYLGTGLDSALDAAAAAGREVELADIVTPELTFAFLLLALVAAIPLAIRKWRAGRRG